MNFYIRQEAGWHCPWLRPKGQCPDPFVWPEDCPVVEDVKCSSYWHRRRACVRRRTNVVQKCCVPDAGLVQTRPSFLQQAFEAANVTNATGNSSTSVPPPPVTTNVSASVPAVSAPPP